MSVNAYALEQLEVAVTAGWPNSDQGNVPEQRQRHNKAYSQVRGDKEFASRCLHDAHHTACTCAIANYATGGLNT